jgi:hypothetical protein
MNKIDQIIERIADLQNDADQRFFPEGLFESSRSNDFLGYHRPDTNIFFSAITVFTLNKIKGNLSEKSQKIVQQISEKVIQNYPLFQNKDGLKTYNFFQTKPSRHFPNGKFLHRFNHFKIPDDIDDTAMVFLTSEYSQEDANNLKIKLLQHSNGYQLVIKNTLPEYANLYAYSTWFGKNMYIEFDACALTNILYCLLSYGLELDQHGQDSLEYIKGVILKKQYLTQPFSVAHQYKRTPLIMYHVGRLLADFDLPNMKEAREVLVNDMQEYLQKELHIMDRILILTTLKKLKTTPCKSILYEEIVSLKAEDFKGFYFFIAGFLTAYQIPILYKLASSSVFHINWFSEAHCWTLIVEYLSIGE